jgi:hypothetical protein
MLGKAVRKILLIRVKIKLNIILKWTLQNYNVYEIDLAQNKVQSQKSKLIKGTDLGR